MLFGHHRVKRAGVFLVSVLYSCLFFGLIHIPNRTQLTVYLFTMISFLILLLLLRLTREPSGEEESIFPQVRVRAAAAFVLGQMIGSIFLAVRYRTLPPSAIVAVEMLFQLQFLLTVLLTGLPYCSEMTAAEAYADASKIRDLSGQLGGIAALTADEKLKERITDLAEEFYYSPVINAGTPELEDLETRIIRNVDMLREEAEDGKTDRMALRIEKLTQLLDERNDRIHAGGWG